jgi:DNA ligase-1
MSVSKPTTITLVKHVPLHTVDEVKKQYATALNAGFEGLVLKTPDHIYQPGKRSSDWLKLKPTLSKDLPIIGFFEGEGRLTGTLGGVDVIHISEFGDRVTVKVGSGFTDALRDEIWNNQSRYLGKTIEVKYQEETEDGSLRHPRFKSFRPDKD